MSVCRTLLKVPYASSSVSLLAMAPLHRRSFPWLLSNVFCRPGLFALSLLTKALSQFLFFSIQYYTNIGEGQFTSLFFLMVSALCVLFKKMFVSPKVVRISSCEAVLLYLYGLLCCRLEFAFVFGLAQVSNFSPHVNTQLTQNHVFTGLRCLPLLSQARWCVLLICLSVFMTVAYYLVTVVCYWL